MSEMFLGNKPEATKPEGRNSLLGCLLACDRRLEMWMRGNVWNFTKEKKKFLC